MNTQINILNTTVNIEPTFLDAVNTYYEYQADKVRKGTYIGYIQRIRHLQRFINVRKLLPADIDQIFADNYKVYLINQNLGHNTILKHLKFVKQALKHYAKMHPKKRFDLNEIQNLKPQATKPKPCNANQILLLKNAKLPKSLDNSRDYFLFLVETGFHFSDGLTVRKSHITKHGDYTIIQKNRIKTNIEAILPASDLAMSLLAKHNYDFKIKSNAEFNKNLKIIAEIAEIDKKLCASDARDTFADHWGNEKSESLDDIAIMMGLNSTRELPKYFQARSKRILNMMEKNKKI
jgi:Phage integrase SAM-like domain